MDILIGILLVLIVGILPMLVYALILWWFDRYEKEPLGLSVAAFLWGAVPAVIFSIIAELVLDVPIAYFVDPVAAGVIGIAVVAPVAEEIFKGMALLLLLLFFRIEIVHPMIDVAVHRVPILMNASFLTGWTGVRPVTADDLPILGPVPSIDGFILNCGWGGKGIIQAPIAGQLVAEWIRDGQTSTMDIGPFRIDR